MSGTADDLTKTVLETVRAGSLSKKVAKVAIEPDVDEEGNEFLRVLITMRGADPELDPELEDLLEKIETALLNIDNRYPSVRFLDAA